MPSALRKSTSERLVKAANRAVREAARSLGGEHVHKGGYFRLFTLMNPQAGHERLVQLYEGWAGGQSNRENYAKYHTFSFEKALRLAQMHKAHGHVSSWQSRDVSQALFGGAVLLYCDLDKRGAKQAYFVLSFSGLPELGDEAAVLRTAHLMWHVRSNMRDIVDASDNERAWGLIEVPF
jgi:hypothetical protein